MVTKISKIDSNLAKRLEVCTRIDPEYWSFRRNAVRDHCHGIFQYPAMMVPQMQSQLIGDILEVDKSVHCVYDPFVGSGTVLTEAMIRGLDFQGCDLNPLAVLVSRVKAGPFFFEALRRIWYSIKERTITDRCREVECRYSAWQKWFKTGVAIKLTRLARAIRTEESLWARRFFWVVLAETIRLTSNSRTSTFKLHVRPSEEIEKRTVDPFEIFACITERNLQRIKDNAELLKKAGKLQQGLYKGTVQVEWGDSGGDCKPNKFSTADLLVTSPPYGDNVTTVPYGQHAFLPLQWIDLNDIESGIPCNLISNTHSIDTRSLGGARSGALGAIKDIGERSESLSRVFRNLRNEPRDRSVRVAAFWRDMDKCLTTVLKRLRKYAYMVWIVGERRVGNRIIPMHKILAELLESRGSMPVALLQRRIPSKRMAVRNDTSETMLRERILIMRKGGS